MAVVSVTEHKILQAAKEVFIKEGMYGARMQDIADAAGINKALLHYYFRSKDLLFNKVFEEAFLNYITTMDIWTDESLTFVQKLQKYVDVYIDFLTEYPLVPMFLIKEISTNPEILREKIQAKKKLRNCPTLIEFLKKELPQHTAHISPEMLMMNIQSLCTYPFLAEPLYKSMFRLPQKDWDNIKTKELKRTVKKFIEIQLTS